MNPFVQFVPVYLCVACYNNHCSEKIGKGNMSAPPLFPKSQLPLPPPLPARGGGQEGGLRGGVAVSDALTGALPHTDTSPRHS